MYEQASGINFTTTASGMIKKEKIKRKCLNSVFNVEYFMK